LVARFELGAANEAAGTQSSFIASDAEGLIASIPAADGGARLAYKGIRDGRIDEVRNASVGAFTSGYSLACGGRRRRRRRRLRFA